MIIYYYRESLTFALKHLLQMKDIWIFLASISFSPERFKCGQFLQDLHAIDGVHACKTASHTPQADTTAINDFPAENDHI